MVPLALFVYNRPEHTKQVLSALRENNIDLLYVFSDAAKKDASSVEVGEVRDINDKIDWDKIEIVKRAEHGGLANSVKQGVAEILQRYDKLIVLEDDCVPSSDFYNYMCQCLEHYEDEERVFCTSAYSHPIKKREFKKYPYDVFFWQRFWSWGWGTWRRAWQKYDPDLERLLRTVKAKNINLEKFGRDILSTIQAQVNKKIDSWAVNWFLTIIVNDALTVYPVSSRINNIGYDGSGVHCGLSKKYDVELTSSISAEKLRFPEQIEENKEIIRQIIKFI